MFHEQMKCPLSRDTKLNEINVVHMLVFHSGSEGFADACIHTQVVCAQAYRM